MSFLDADYSAIEARITCWLAGQEDALQEYRDNVDRYKVMASVIYRVPPEQVNKHPQRFVGKQATLGCIAEGELVLTDSGLVPIEKVKDWHRVWDGVEWVSHEGLIYQGQKEVITYDGLTATPDHTVFIGMGSKRTTDLWSAREQKLGLTISEQKGAPVRTMETCYESSFSLTGGIPLRKGEMQMWYREPSLLLDFIKGSKYGMRSLRSRGSKNVLCSFLAAEANGICERQMRQSEQQSVQKLWCARDRVQIQVCCAGSKLGNGQLGSEEGTGDRPQEQQWTLRAGEPPLRHSQDTSVELPGAKDGFHLRHEGLALLQTDDREVSATGNVSGAGFGLRSFSSSRETQRVEAHPKKVATFDLLNAGPRHRFTVSGKLVHNCGFGMGPPKFRATCWKMGRYKLPEGLEYTAVAAWRQKHKKVVSYWYDVERAARNAILRKGEVFAVRERIKFMVKNIEGMEFLLLRLPSGRKLAYPKPRLCGDRVAFYGNVKGAVWGDVSTWGGSLVENAVQGIAADVMCVGSHNAEQENYPIAMLVHDQAIAFQTNGQTPERFVELLTRLPSWADGLPIAAEGAVVPFYRKE